MAGFMKAATGKGSLANATTAMGDKVKAMKAAKAAADAMNRPKMAAYETLRDNAGGLQDQYKLKAGAGVNLNTQAMDELRKQALAKESPWLAQQLQANQAQGLRQQNSAAKLAATGAAQGMASLARRGGLSGGAAERMAQGAGDSRMLAQQEAAGQTDANQLNLMVGDAQSQRGLLQAMPGMELAQGQFAQNERAYNTGVDQFNLGNVLNEVKRKQDFDLTKYSEQMKGYGAEKSAAAVEKGGK